MYSIITIVRCGTISVNQSVRAHAGIEHGPRVLLILKQFSALTTISMVAGRKLKNLGLVLFSILIGNFCP